MAIRERKNKTDNGTLQNFEEKKRINKEILKVSEATGETKKRTLLEEEGKKIVLNNNFTASPIGCKTPPNLTLLGPTRLPV